MARYCKGHYIYKEMTEILKDLDINSHLLYYVKKTFGNSQIHKTVTCCLSILTEAQTEGRHLMK